MYENTILNALVKYRIHIQTDSRFSSEQINCRLNSIKVCEDYIEQGNKISIDWLKNNHIPVSKAVNYAHSLIHRNYIESDREYSSKEHKELNRCMCIYTYFYNEIGFGSDYINIDIQHTFYSM